MRKFIVYLFKDGDENSKQKSHTHDVYSLESAQEIFNVLVEDIKLGKSVWTYVDVSDETGKVIMKYKKEN